MERGKRLGILLSAVGSVCVLLSSTMCAQTERQGRLVQDKRFEFKPKFVDENGLPLRSVTVLFNGKRYVSKSDGIATIPLGRHSGVGRRAFVYAPGFAPRRIVLLDLHGRQVLRKGMPLKLSVVDSDGSPLPNAKLRLIGWGDEIELERDRLLRSSSRFSSLPRHPGLTTKTNEIGIGVLRDVPEAGFAVVEVSKPTFLRRRYCIVLTKSGEVANGEYHGMPMVSSSAGLMIEPGVKTTIRAVAMGDGKAIAISELEYRRFLNRVPYETVEMKTENPKSVDVWLKPNCDYMVRVKPDPKSQCYGTYAMFKTPGVGKASEVDVKVKKGVWIDGRLLDKDSKKPIGVISGTYFGYPPETDPPVSRQWNNSFVSDADGKFRLLVGPHHGSIRINNAYWPSAYSGRQPSTKLTPPDDDREQALTIFLKRNRALKGQVRGPDGRGIKANYLVLNIDGPIRGQTEDNGEYEIGSIYDGTLAEQFEQLDEEFRPGYSLPDDQLLYEDQRPRVFFYTADFKFSETKMIPEPEPGSIKPMSLNVKLKKSKSVSGIVLDGKTIKPKKDATAFLGVAYYRGGDPLFLQKIQVGANGKFSINGFPEHSKVFIQAISNSKSGTVSKIVWNGDQNFGQLFVNPSIKTTAISPIEVPEIDDWKSEESMAILYNAFGDEHEELTQNRNPNRDLKIARLVEVYGPAIKKIVESQPESEHVVQLVSRVLGNDASYYTRDQDWMGDVRQVLVKHHFDNPRVIARLDLLFRKDLKSLSQLAELVPTRKNYKVVLRRILKIQFEQLDEFIGSKNFDSEKFCEMCRDTNINCHRLAFYMDPQGTVRQDGTIYNPGLGSGTYLVNEKDKQVFKSLRGSIELISKLPAVVPMGSSIDCERFGIRWDKLQQFEAPSDK